MNGKKRHETGTRRIALVIFVAALAVRLVYLLESSKGPTFLVPIVDAENYDSIARSLAFGGVMNQTFFWQGFFYPLFLAAVYLAGGGSIIAVKLVQLVLGAVTALLSYQIGSRTIDRRTGVIAGAVTALYGPLVFFEGELLATGWAAFWAAALITFLLRAQLEHSIASHFMLGICGALAVLTRGTFLPFFIAAVVWLLATPRRGTKPPAHPGGARPPRRAYRRWPGTVACGGALAAGFLLIAVPVSILSRDRTGQFTILPQSGAINLYIGNNPDADATLMIRPGSQWRDLTRLPTVYGSTSAEKDRRFFMNRFWTYMRDEPGGYVSGLFRKALQFVSSRELPRNVDVYIYRSYSRLLSLLVWKADGFGFPFGFILPLAIIGTVAYRRRIPAPIHLFLILYPLSIILVFVTSRYRTPIIPVLAVPAAAGITSVADAIRLRKRLRAALMAAAIAAIATLTSIPGPFAAERYDYESEMHCCVGFELMKHGSLDDAAAHLERALRLRPGYGDAHKFLGLIDTQRRNFDDARRHFELALDADPDSYLLRYYLGTALLNLGMHDEAVRELERALAGAESAREGALVERLRALLRGTAQPESPSPEEPPPAEPE